MANTWISETENDIEELQITHEDITEHISLRNKLHNFEGFQEKQKLFVLRKGEKNTRKELERYGGKGKRKELVETNVVHSGLFDTKK